MSLDSRLISKKYELLNKEKHISKKFHLFGKLSCFTKFNLLEKVCQKTKFYHHCKLREVANFIKNTSKNMSPIPHQIAEIMYPSVKGVTFF